MTPSHWGPFQGQPGFSVAITTWRICWRWPAEPWRTMSTKAQRERMPRGCHGIPQCHYGIEMILFCPKQAGHTESVFTARGRQKHVKVWVRTWGVFFSCKFPYKIARCAMAMHVSFYQFSNKSPSGMGVQKQFSCILARWVLWNVHVHFSWQMSTQNANGGVPLWHFSCKLR